MPFTLIQNGNVYTPKPVGVQSVLLYGDKIVKIGPVSANAVEALGVELDIIDASGCAVMPGLIDPHAHLIGAGGEDGFASRMPELQMQEIARAGITTVIGLLGTDTVTRHLEALQSKVSQLMDEGMNAFFYTGGFQLPPTTLTGSVQNDLVMIDKIIGTGEIALSDYRWIDPSLEELADVVTATMLGGKMSGKAGVTHFHIGDGKNRLSLLNQMLDTYEMPPTCVYATHIMRTEALLDDAIRLARRGAYVDMDTVEEDTVEKLSYYLERGGPPEQITISSDARTPGGSPEKFYAMFQRLVCTAGIPLDQALMYFSSNAAKILKLQGKGVLKEEAIADVLVARQSSLEIKDLLICGRACIRDGEWAIQTKEEQQLEESKASDTGGKS